MKKSISKSQYIKGLQCPKSLWFYRHRKDLMPEISDSKQAIFDQGNEVGELAKTYFPGGVEATATHMEIDLAAEQTIEFVENGEDVIFEACAINPEGIFSRIDILKREDDEWDLIEVKSSTGVADYHLDDMASQRYAFEGAGFKIRKSILMHINNKFVKQGEIDPKKIFHLEDCTEDVIAKMETVKAELPRLLKIVSSKKEPQIGIGNQCKKPFDCDYKDHCWAHVPEYSVYKAASGKKLLTLVNDGVLDAKDIPDDFPLAPTKSIDVAAYKSGEVVVDKSALQSFMSELTFPLYHLDYETVGLNIPIPFIDGTSPYKQIPFQYSLHIQHENGDLEHKEFLFQGEGDPRPELVKRLVEDMQGEGSVIAYNAPFEIGVNKDLAVAFKEHKNELEAFNDRMVDLLIPFRKRHLYHPAQNSSASIKAVLPAFFPDMSYAELDIGDGGSASRLYTNILKGQIQGEQKEKIFEGLLAYCEHDTLAMVKLIELIQSYCR